MSKLPHQSTVSYVDLPRFMGRWYVISAIPTMFEKGAHNPTENYTWNAEKDRIDVDYRYNKDSFEGPEKSIPQKAFVYNHESGAEWRVQPLWPFKFAYLIIALADDYSDCMIGVPDRSHLWIMARKPQMTKKRYDELLKRAGALGYDLSKLEEIPQEKPAAKKKAG